MDLTSTIGLGLLAGKSLLGAGNNLTNPSAARMAGAGLNPGGASTSQIKGKPGVNIFPQGASSPSNDWRVRISLPKNFKADTTSSNAQNTAGLQEILKRTNGVVFPYLPQITVTHNARYQEQALTHSNYKNYFYEGSDVAGIQISGEFTVQNWAEGQYLLACIYFFRTVTKMFWGTEEHAGNPPPLVYLNGFGDFYFPNVTCIVTNFTHTLPNDVDYIRAGTAVDDGTNFLDNRVRTTIGSNPLSYAINRLLNNNLTKGALDIRPNANGPKPPVDIPTYVPTKMEIAISLLPMQSRQQVSTQFSLQAFANGNLLRGGFW